MVSSAPPLLCPSTEFVAKKTALLAHVTSDQETGPVLRLCYDLGVEDVARLSGGEVNGRHSSLVFLNGSIVGATGCVVSVFIHFFLNYVSCLPTQCSACFVLPAKPDTIHRICNTAIYFF